MSEASTALRVFEKIQWFQFMHPGTFKHRGWLRSSNTINYALSNNTLFQVTYAHAYVIVFQQVWEASNSMVIGWQLN